MIGRQQTQVVRTSAMALYFPAVEYAYPVWTQSTQAKRLNETSEYVLEFRCLGRAKVNNLYLLTSTEPPNMRRKVFAEKTNQIQNLRHPMYGQNTETVRPKSRKSFLTSISSIPHQMLPQGKSELEDGKEVWFIRKI